MLGMTDARVRFQQAPSTPRSFCSEPAGWRAPAVGAAGGSPLRTFDKTWLLESGVLSWLSVKWRKGFSASVGSAPTWARGIFKHRVYGVRAGLLNCAAVWRTASS